MKHPFLLYSKKSRLVLVKNTLDIPGLDEAALALVARKGHWMTAPAGTRVFEPGKQCQQFYLLTLGRIKVQIVAESGREIVLYRIGPGDACVMTVSCLMGHGLYNGEGVVEEATEGYAIGLSLFNELMATSDKFRSSILEDYSERFLDLVNVLENVAFRPLEARLAAKLLEMGRGADGINCTHQFLATDLGSAREVISRLLKKWEDSGFIRLERGSIQILSTEHLTSFVART